ncbi:MAG: sugar ABC transporter permease [Chloroflexi bacterium]|nr:sugar ABC transporter permease [Chloroflexota bacterium]
MVAQAAARKPGLSRAARREELAGYLFISPWLIGFLLLSLGPLLAAIYLSLTRYDALSPPRFIGLANFERLAFDDELVWHSLRITAVYSVFSVVGHIVLGLMVALLLNRNIRGIAVYRTVYYLPSVVSGVAVAMMWLWVFSPEMGVVNSMLRLVGIEGPKWLFSSQWALPTFVIMGLWNVGGSMVLYLAGLQGVPTALYEAAMIDGAGRWPQFRHITIPMISPVILFTLVMGIIGSFQVFTSAFVMTRGGPGDATRFFVLLIYQNAFEFFKFGYASALAWVLFAVIIALTLLMFKLSGRWVHYEGELRK